MRKFRNVHKVKGKGEREKKKREKTQEEKMGYVKGQTNYCGQLDR